MLDSEWGSWPERKLIVDRERTGHRTVRVALSMSLFFFFFTFFLSVLLLLFNSVFCSALTPTHEFCLFLSILLPTPAGGGVIE